MRVLDGGEAVEKPCTQWDFDDSVFTNTLTSEVSQRGAVWVCSRSLFSVLYLASVVVFLLMLRGKHIRAKKMTL